MFKNKIITIFTILCISNISHNAYKQSSQQLIKKINKPQFAKPKTFNPYKTALPLSAPQIHSLLLKQPTQLQNKISRHPFFKELIIEVPNIEITKQTPIKFNEKTLLKLEIFMYCMNHPQEAEEIMNFYQEIKDAQQLIKERLEFLPLHAQEFFKQQVQKYLNSEFEYDQNSNINPAQIKILRLYPYVITALMLGFSILMLVAVFIFTNLEERFDIKELSASNPSEKELLEIFNLLIDALNLEPIKIYRPNLKYESLVPEPALAGYIPFIQLMIVNPEFFKKDLDSQIFILLHELRHYQQDQITIPEDVIKYAQEKSVDPLDFNLVNLFSTGWFWSTAMLEFDADLFAARQMKDYPWINTLVTEIKGPFNKIVFNPKTGYLSSQMISQESSHGNKITILAYLEKKWDKFINAQPNENMYLRYVPQHLKEAAVKNKALREEKKLALQEAQQVFEEYREF